MIDNKARSAARAPQVKPGRTHASDPYYSPGGLSKEDFRNAEIVAIRIAGRLASQYPDYDPAQITSGALEGVVRAFRRWRPDGGMGWRGYLVCQIKNYARMAIRCRSSRPMETFPEVMNGRSAGLTVPPCNDGTCEASDLQILVDMLTEIERFVVTEHTLNGKTFTDLATPDLPYFVLYRAHRRGIDRLRKMVL